MVTSIVASDQTKFSSGVKISQVRFSWPKSTTSLRIKNLCIDAGEQVFLYGPSGSGKTTLLNLIAGIVTPQEGYIDALGQRITDLKPAQRDRFRALHMGVIFQQLNLIPFLSVADNIRLPLKFAHVGGKSRELQAQVPHLLSSLGLDPQIASSRSDRLSVGQQQRVALARALITHPGLLIADEPTSALDEDSRDSFLDLMQKVTAPLGTTVLFVSHDRSLAPHFDRSLDIRDLCEVAA